MSWRYLKGQYESWTASSWPIASGRVASCEVEIPSGQRRADLWEVKVSYEYIVDGRSFSGSRIHPTYFANTRPESYRQLSERLKVGNAVGVRYRPSDPKQSYLAVEPISSGVLPLVVGLTFAAAGVAFGATFWLVNYGNYDYASLIKSP